MNVHKFRMALYEDVYEMLKKHIDSHFGGSVNAFAEASGVQQSSLSRFFKRTHAIRLDIAARALDHIGAKVVLPGQLRSLTAQQAAPLMLPPGQEQPKVAKLLEKANAVLVAAEGHADDAAALRLAMSMLGKQLEGLEHGEAPPELRRENG